MKRITVAQAAEEWGVREYTARYFCARNTLPPGYSVIVKGKGKRKSYYIWRLDDRTKEEMP